MLVSLHKSSMVFKLKRTVHRHAQYKILSKSGELSTDMLEYKILSKSGELHVPIQNFV